MPRAPLSCRSPYRYDNAWIRAFSRTEDISRVDTNSRRTFQVAGEELPIRRWNVTIDEAYKRFLESEFYTRWRHANRKPGGELPTLGRADRSKEAGVPTTFRLNI